MLKSRRRLLLKLFLFALLALGLVLAYLDIRIISTFNDRMWELPAKVYARPLELYADASLTAGDFAYELGTLGYREVSMVDQPGEMRQSGTSFEVYTRGFRFPTEQEPARLVRIDLRGGRVRSLRGPEGDIDLMRLDPVQIGGIYPTHGEDRILLRLEDVPDTLRKGLLAVEDRNYYDHWGFSIKGMLRAAFNNMRSGSVVAGGSTVTQQLVKNYYLTSERTYTRKITELMMAVLLDLHYDKDRILESYMNEVYLGQDGPRAIHGLALASRYYFSTPLAQLSLPQQALLIGMIKGPSYYNPLRNPNNALQRRNLVLDVMSDEGVISREEALKAKSMPLGLSGRSVSGSDTYPAYLDLVRRQLSLEYREEDLTSLGLSIFTSFDPLLQRQVEVSTSTVMDRLDDEGEMQAATVVTRFDTGEVVAVVGGRNARYAGFNRAIDAQRPAGSLLKPAVYLAALEQPEKYTLATPLLDAPLVLDLPNGDTWSPLNFDRESHGEVLLHQALSKSYNQASARLGLALGMDKVVDMLHRLGIDGYVPEVPALTLGAGEYSPMDMAAMYQSIAAGGFRMPLRSIRDIVDAQGESLRRYPLEYDRSVSPQAVNLLHYALQEVVREGTGRGVYSYLERDFAVAGKTGTTNDGRDSWFAGFSGDLLTVTWMGRDDNADTGFTGSSGALHVWAHFMSRASQRPLAYRMPDGMEHLWVDNTNGYLTGRGCANAQQLPFIIGSGPVQSTGCSSSGNVVKDWFQELFNGEHP